MIKRYVLVAESDSWGGCLTKEQLDCISRHYLSAAESRFRKRGGVVGDGFSAHWYFSSARPTWVSAVFNPVRYLISLRIRLIRRPLRTGKVLGITVMSYYGQPEMTRLP